MQFAQKSRSLLPLDRADGLGREVVAHAADTGDLPLYVRHNRRRYPQIPVPSNKSTIAASVASCWEMEDGLRWLPMRSHAVDVHRLCAGAD